MKKRCFLFLFFFCYLSADEKIISFADYQETWKESIQHSEQFWKKEAKMLFWNTPYHTVWQSPKNEQDQFIGRWFVGGKLNVTYNCIDKWAYLYPDATALIWISEEDLPEKKVERLFTYKDLFESINQVANGLKDLGVKKGDRVCIWLPMIPELIISQFACAKIGAIHSVVFSGFSPKSVQDRILDAECKVVITSDEAIRKGKKGKMKEALDPFLKSCSSVETVLVVQRTNYSILMQKNRDVFWNNLVCSQPKTCSYEAVESEDPLFILYTSGTTGKPKGIVHSTAGYLLYAMSTMKYIWNIQGLLGHSPDLTKREIWFCTADIGWITGHSYVTFAPFALGTVVVMYEGAPTYPHEGKLWEIIDRHQVTHFYTAPTLIRSLMVNGTKELKKYSLSSLKVLGSVGEPINPEAWDWYFTHVGKKRCPIVDTYWQTETGGFLIAPIAGITPLKPGSCTVPFLGIQPKIIEGSLCITKPWPGIARTIFHDHQRFFSTYLKKCPGMYFTGDEAYQDQDGYYWITGRMDDVIKVSGHRLGSAEIEKTIMSCPLVAEAAVVGVPHAIKGQAIFAFVVLKQGSTLTKEDIQKHVRTMHSSISVPDHIAFVEELPKTRSGKILRRLLQSLVLGKNIEETSTLANPLAVEKIKEIIQKSF